MTIILKTAVGSDKAMKDFDSELILAERHVLQVVKGPSAGINSGSKDGVNLSLPAADFRIIPLPSPRELKQKIRASETALTFVRDARATCQNILSGKDPRKAFIVGPCSIHHPQSAMDYAARLKELANEVSDTCFLIMRFYVEKSRTSTGWKGFLYDPYLDGSNAIETGLIWTRKLLLSLAEAQIACATEFVDPLVAPYFDDLISWGFIGARTSSSQPHRQLASSLPMPIGFKNSIDGNVKTAINAILSAEKNHSCLSIDQQGQLCALQSQGNPHTHLVLRGSCQTTNYDAKSISQALELLQEYQLPQRVLIDCAHGNAQKQAEKQRDAFESTLDQILQGNHALFGLMLESHLEGGSQLMKKNPLELNKAISITDPCISWKTTQELIQSAHKKLKLLWARKH